MDTTGLGAGSYPQAPEENEYKCYKFTTEVSAKMNGFIYAHSEEEAKELIECGQNDDIDDFYDIKTENILSTSEVN